MSVAHRFDIIAEKIHCTRTYKRNGAMVEDMGSGKYGVVYRRQGERCLLPISADYLAGADWESGKVRHCAVAVNQGMHGSGGEADAGVDFIRTLAADQAAGGSAFIDVNVDEFSTDNARRVQAVAWVIGLVQEACPVPVSVDSSNIEVLRAGLTACTDRERGRPMLNSVSLERVEGIELAREFDTVVVASAAGEAGLPSTVQERMDNLGRLIPLLREVGLGDDRFYIDPLVLPIATDPSNGKVCIDAITAIRETFGPRIHITGGFSNVSFGMPNRKLINQVFTHLCVQAGADSGIVDPLHINAKILGDLDTGSAGYQLARALLLGEDEFGMNYISASREGRI
jgi:5-methyltetrahydrofolate--homocysteine methyltransferase